jgi:tetrahydromethanopterin S-methyltransferase subunit G
VSVITSDDSLLLLLRRMDEIERKLDRIVEELRMPTAIGYSVRRGNLPRKD